jgi:uncharacterized protein with FMN-binding domain
VVRTRFALLAATGAFVLPPVQGVASSSLAAPTKKVSTAWKQAPGTTVRVDRWGEIQVVLTVRKRTVTVGSKKTVTRKITAVRLPTWPNDGGAHTIDLNKRVLPLLSNQVLREQFKTKIDYISEATDTSIGFEKSLQVALLNGRRV